jgi:hypothetical protein
MKNYTAEAYENSNSPSPKNFAPSESCLACSKRFPHCAAGGAGGADAESSADLFD